MVKALKVDVTLLKADVKMLEGQRDVLKYIAIGASVVAVGAGGYIILK